MIVNIYYSTEVTLNVLQHIINQFNQAFWLKTSKGDNIFHLVKSAGYEVIL